MKRSTKTLWRWSSLGIGPIAFLTLWQFLSPTQAPTPVVPFSNFMKAVRADREREPYVQSASVAEEDITFYVVDPKSGTKEKRSTRAPRQLPDYARELVDRNVQTTFEEQKDSPFWPGALVTLLPLVGIWCLFYWYARRTLRRIETMAMGMTTRDLELEQQVEQHKKRADDAERRLAELAASTEPRGGVGA